MKKISLLLVVVAFLALGAINAVQAQKTVTFTTSIAQGTLIANIRNASGLNVSSPNLHLGDVINTSNCRYSGSSLKESLGDDSQRLFVDNPNAATNGWTLTLASENGNGSLWNGAEGNKFDFNDSGSSGLGCTDSDSDGFGGELMVDVSSADINTHCISCSNNYVSRGSSTVESFANSPSITLMSATNQADTLGSWYMTDVDVIQTVPAGQEGDDYSIEFTLTATAS